MELGLKNTTALAPSAGGGFGKAIVDGGLVGSV
jgi:hypothetical protein